MLIHKLQTTVTTKRGMWIICIRKFLWTTELQVWYSRGGTRWLEQFEGKAIPRKIAKIAATFYKQNKHLIPNLAHIC